MSLKELPDSLFVGYLARENEIAVVEGTGELTCKSLRGAVAFKQVILLLFGGGLTAVVWFSLSHPTLASMPWVVTVLIAVLALVCWLVFLRNLLGTPFFTVKRVGRFCYSVDVLVNLGREFPSLRFHISASRSSSTTTTVNRRKMQFCCCSRLLASVAPCVVPPTSC